MDLIDISLTQSQFDAFEPDIVAALSDATRADLEEWSTRLLDGWTVGNEDEIRRARHSLKGVCGNFGAERLIAMTTQPLTSAEARDQFRVCVEATIAAVLAIAAPRLAG